MKLTSHVSSFYAVLQRFCSPVAAVLLALSLAIFITDFHKGLPGNGLVSAHGYGYDTSHLFAGLLYANLNSTQICLAYGGSCVSASSCATLYLYALNYHSILYCNTTSFICCLPQISFYALYGTKNHYHRRSRRSRHRW